MRRVALVATGAEGDAAQAWLESLPDLVVRRVPALLEIALDATDLIWAHGPVAPHPPLLPWIEAGGRLLASLDAALLPAALGLDPAPPDQQLDLTWHAADGGPLGFAAFGPHPLFDGLAHGADVWAPREGERYRLIGYGATRPRGGTVIAVERSMLRLDASRAIAWEYALGDGGILCLGAYVYLAAAFGSPGAQLHTVLRNAVLGAAIPHRDRSATATGWPTPGTTVRDEPGHSIPALPDLNGAWAPSRTPVTFESDAGSDDPWALPGRRIVALGAERAGVREIWAHPCRLMRDGRIAIGGRAPEATSFRAAPDELVRTLGKGDAVVTERWLTALELPVFVWELEALRADAVLEAHWITDLRRAWPYPAGCFGDLLYTLSRDRTQLYVGAEGGPVQALFSVSGGQLAASPADGPALRVAAVGTGRIRVAAVFGSDRADLERTIHALDRKHFFGLRAQRSQHADQIREYGVSLDSPDAACNIAFEWAKVRADGCIVGAPGVGRSAVQGYPAAGEEVRATGGWYAGAGGCRVALGLLAAGDRDVARDVLKFLLFTLDPAGRPVAEASTSGLAHYEDPGAGPLLLFLAIRLADWSADLPYLGRHWEAVQKAYRGCIESDAEGNGLVGRAAPETTTTWVMALEGLEALAEELGYPVFAEEVRIRAGKARAEASQRGLVVPERTDATKAFDDDAHRRLSRLAATLRLGAKGAFADGSGALVDAAGPAAEFLRFVVEGLWGVTPAALDSAVRIAPSLPAAWPEMTLHRLRVGRTVLDVRIRRRPERLEARIQRVFGPRLHVELTFPGAGKPSAISVDDVALGGARAAFEAEGIHEVVFHYSGAVSGKR